MSVPQLRVVTYLCPSIPVELFQAILEILESKTGHFVNLQYEWRSDGSNDQRLDLFENNLIDLAFMPASGYIGLVEKKNLFAELVPWSPVFKHPNCKDINSAAAGVYVDVIVHADKIQHGVSTLLDLRGCRWACVDEDSLANAVTVDQLQHLGENITFFGSVHRTISHLSAVNMVLTKQVDAATIDSSALICNKRFLHKGAKDVVVLTNYGPYAPYAIVVNNRLQDELKKKIISTLTSINCKDLEKYGLIKFAPNHPDAYKKQKHFMNEMNPDLSQVPYY